MNRYLILLLVGMLALLLLSQILPLGGLQDEDDAKPLLPGLAAAREAVNRVLVTRLGQEDEQLSIVMGEQGWNLAEKSGYPVDITALIELLDAVAEARLSEQKTSKASFHPRLGLAADGAADEVGIQIDIQAGDEQFIFIKGIESSAQVGTFIRYPGEAQVWLVNRTFNASVNPLDWIDPIAINLDAERVLGVEMIREARVQLAATRGDIPGAQVDDQIDDQGGDQIDAQGGDQIGDQGGVQSDDHGGAQVAGAARGELTLLNPPPDRELKYPTIVSSLARILVNLRFEDVSPYAPKQWSKYGLARVETDSGAIIEARTRRLDEQFLLHVQIDTSAITDVVKSDPENTADDVLEDLLEQQKHLKKWQFVITEHVFNELNKTMDDMFKDEAAAQ